MHTTTNDSATPEHGTVAVHRSRYGHAPRPGDTSSPRASVRTSRRARRVGLLAGAAVALLLLSSCSSVEQWVPDFNRDGHIDQAEIDYQSRVIVNALAALDAERRAVQNHPFLRCVRAHESGGNYVAQNPRSSASGAYQFLDSTWRRVSPSAGLAGYSRAMHAPWYVQDSVALWLYNNGGRSAWAGTGC